MIFGGLGGDSGENPDARPEEGRGPPRPRGEDPRFFLSDVFALPLEEGVETRPKKKVLVQGLLYAHNEFCESIVFGGPGIAG